ncbi:Sec-independent protein translocase subunit TatA [Pseudonocardia sp.]|uniref:Sec-independent protein translocase subunit TatA n=1 Tax=Pseudonocardia sp. TaxID=60912 RepID=UPI003D0F2B6A
MPGTWEWLIIAGIIVLLFGVKKLPEMARSVGQSARVFKGEMKGLREDEARAAAQDTAHVRRETAHVRREEADPPVTRPTSAPVTGIVVDPYPVPPSGRGV